MLQRRTIQYIDVLSFSADDIVCKPATPPADVTTFADTITVTPDTTIPLSPDTMTTKSPTPNPNTNTDIPDENTDAIENNS